MFRRLAANTAISAVAFFAISVLGLVIVPVLVGAYGLAAFGLISMSRIFLPTGVLALFDFGVSEVAIQATARAREDQEWERCGGQLSLLLVMSVLLGLLSALTLGFGARPIAGLIHAPSEMVGPFGSVLIATALVLPVLFVSLVAEGVLKGFERYGVIRMLEVSSTLAYTVAALVLVKVGLTFETVCYAYLAVQILRSLLSIVLALVTLSREPCRFGRWTKADLGEVGLRSRLIVYSRLLGSLQGQAPTLLIGFLFGSAAVGAYDILSKLPRFAKSVLGLINSTLLPVAVRLETTADHQAIAKLGETGLLVIILVTLPAVSGGMVFSEDILRLWLGPQMQEWWEWQSAMFVMPALMAMIGFGGISLLSRPDAAKQLNRVTTLQVALQLTLSLGLSTLLKERAFILGQALSLCLTFPLSMNIIIKQQRLSGVKVYGWVAKGMLVSACLAVIAVLLPDPPSLIWLGGALVVWFGVAVLLYWLVLPGAAERALLTRLVEPLVGGRLKRLLRR